MLDLISQQVCYRRREYTTTPSGVRQQLLPQRGKDLLYDMIIVDLKKITPTVAAVERVNSTKLLGPHILAKIQLVQKLHSTGQVCCYFLHKLGKKARIQPLENHQECYQNLLPSS